MWRKNQKLWIIYMTGAQAAKVAGKYRGKGRMVRAWVHWRDKDLPLNIKEFEISDEFYYRIV
jgi:hypothetical protein